MQAKEFLIRADTVNLGTFDSLVCCLFSVTNTKMMKTIIKEMIKIE